jgi:hypothetical protein
MRYRGTEIAGGRPFTIDPNLPPARIDSFTIPAEAVVDQDVVLWYAAHFLHDEAHAHPGGHHVGPNLRPEIGPPEHPTDRSPAALMRLLPPPALADHFPRADVSYETRRIERPR